MWTFNKNDVQDRSFEAIKQLSLTKGRLILSQNWKKIIRHLNFLKQTLFQDKFGIKICKNRAELSK